MNQAALKPLARHAATVGGTVLMVLTLSGCMSSEEQRRANLYEDTGTCSDYGARYGSRSHTNCMLQQQQRRDNEQLRNLERARISSETARNNLETLKLLRERRRQG